ncbi:MAG: nucleotidyltransferase family protein [Pseudomonadota bacterium]
MSPVPPRPRPIEAAMVLAAGRGTRMRPLTERMPKALVRVAGHTLVDRALDRVAAAGIARAVVNIHHFAPMLAAHLAGRAGPPAIALSDETEALLETGGGVRRALPLLGPAPFLVLNADAVFAGPDPLGPLLAAWDPARMDALMLLVPRSATRGYTRPGDFLLSAEGAVPERRGARETAPLVYSGAQVLAPGALDGTPEGAFSLNPVWDRLIDAGRLAAVTYPGLWADVGTPAGIAEAEAALAEAEAGGPPV